ncbi:MAG: hypothetical protein IRZ10_01725 [Thermoflavifilum sp.]|nr:hypothetical protein [Thermoflavifilum sp.]MCL6513109.1 MazG-like family protein [Alicyclobacillus sp.]
MNPDPHVHIARKIRAVETAKVELIQQVTDAFRGLQHGDQRELAQSLGTLVGLSYFIAHQMGISLSAVNREACEGLVRVLGSDMLEATDSEPLFRHLGVKR